MAWLDKQASEGGAWTATPLLLKWNGVVMGWWSPEGTPTVLRSSVLKGNTKHQLDLIAARAKDLYGEVERASAYTPPPSPWTLVAASNLLLGTPHKGPEGDS